jgi:hypothetical protein
MLRRSPAAEYHYMAFSRIRTRPRLRKEPTLRGALLNGLDVAVAADRNDARWTSREHNAVELTGARGSQRRISDEWTD